MKSINEHAADRKVQSNPSPGRLQPATSSDRRSKPTRPIDLTPAAPEQAEIPTRKQPWKRAKVHKGKMECCQCCNPTGFAAARHREEKERERR